MRTIFDALIAKNVTWRFYGGGFNDAVAGRPNAFCSVCPMLYATSIMANPAVRAEHLKDIVDFRYAAGGVFRKAHNVFLILLFLR